MSAGIARELLELDQRIARLDAMEYASVREPLVGLGLYTAHLQLLAGHKGLWAGGVQPTGNLVDISGMGAELTDTATPNIGTDDDRGFPIIDFSGSNWFWSADASHWDVTGSWGSISAWSQGLTLGAWIQYKATATATEYIMSKRTTSGANLSYYMYRNATGFPEFRISTDGAATFDVAHTTAVTSGTDDWHFILGPSTSIGIYLDGVWVLNTTSIPATIYSGTADFFMGARDDTSTPGLFPTSAWMSLPFICATAIDDNHVDRLYHLSRHVYTGVF
jgi:hypothetical protein